MQPEKFKIQIVKPAWKRTGFYNGFNILYFIKVRGICNMTTGDREIIASVEKRKEILADASDTIWGYAETRFEEYRSSKLLQKLLTDEGFTIKSGIADMETAFVASYGSGKPVIAFLGEFDALYRLSQKAGVACKEAVTEDGKGHGCGHNALGVGALAAAVAIKDYLEKHHLPGTVRYYGCPGEESGSGKAYIARAGYFNDVDAAFTWHPGNVNTVWYYNCLACICAYFKFTGVSSHAAASPYLGRSALDAVELMDVGANYLREHVVPEARIHYAVTDTGGISPNVVQANASVLYQVRAPHMDQVKEIYDRVVNIAKGAALMTGTKVDIVFDRASAELVPNRTIQKILQRKFEEIGPVPVEEKDRKFAREIRATLDDRQKKADESDLIHFYGEKGSSMQKEIADKDIIDRVYPCSDADYAIPISTDVGDASWNMPTGQVITACFAKDTPGHSWQLVAQGKMPLCHKAFLHAGKVLAMAARELLENPPLLEKAKAEFQERTGGKAYHCQIPADVKPLAKR